MREYSMALVILKFRGPFRQDGKLARGTGHVFDILAQDLLLPRLATMEELQP